MSNPKIVIIVENGSVQAVYSTEDIQYIIVDKDVEKYLSFPLDEYEPDSIITEGEYSKIRGTGKTTD